MKRLYGTCDLTNTKKITKAYFDSSYLFFESDPFCKTGKSVYAHSISFFGNVEQPSPSPSKKNPGLLSRKLKRTCASFCLLLSKGRQTPAYISLTTHTEAE
jgi:hypothetical protein